MSERNTEGRAAPNDISGQAGAQVTPRQLVRKPMVASLVTGGQSTVFPKPLSERDEQEIASAVQSNPDLVYVRIENEREVRLSFVPNYVTVKA